MPASPPEIDDVGICYFDNQLADFWCSLLFQNALEQLALDPRFHELFSLLKTARNGAVYGTKVRFPHALV